MSQAADMPELWIRILHQMAPAALLSSTLRPAVLALDPSRPVLYTGPMKAEAPGTPALRRG